RLLDQIAQLTQNADSEQTVQSALQAERSKLEEQIASIEQLKEIRDLARSVGEGLTAVEIEDRDIARLSAEMSAAQEQAASLPALQAEMDRLKGLAAQVERINALAQERTSTQARIDQLQEARLRLEKLTSQRAERHEQAQRLRQDLPKARE